MQETEEEDIEDDLRSLGDPKKSWQLRFCLDQPAALQFDVIFHTEIEKSKSVSQNLESNVPKKMSWQATTQDNLKPPVFVSSFCVRKPPQGEDDLLPTWEGVPKGVGLCHAYGFWLKKRWNHKVSMTF